LNANEEKIKAFMQLYRPVQQKLSAYCRVVACNEQQASDLVQETLTAAFINFETLRDASSFLYFLCGIARNCHLKQSRRLRFWGKESEIKPSNIQIDYGSIEMQPDVDFLNIALAKLNAEQRDVILLFHIMGFTIAEIAQNMNITEAAVKNRLMRGREKLRLLLSDKESAITENISAKPINTEGL
jgi:RNA polymerase sigma-70 factor (ECF subfamily)